MINKTYNQSEHDGINNQEYPGTRELCCECDDPTGRAGKCEDSIYAIAYMGFQTGKHVSGKYVSSGEECGPFCHQCYRKLYENGMIE